jgi:ribonuclease HII
MLRAMFPTLFHETAARERGYLRIAGVDEVGRGPLAGPVLAAAVILDPARIPVGLNDSKVISAKERQRLHDEMHEVAEVSIGEASVAEIESHNILRASHLAMLRALDGLTTPPDYALIDGNLMPRDMPFAGEPIIKGDSLSVSIAAASIVAKICRDCVMLSLAQQHPGYGWETNMGYGTKSHIEALGKIGVTPHHRRKFKPVHNILYQDKLTTS